MDMTEAAAMNKKGFAREVFDPSHKPLPKDVGLTWFVRLVNWRRQYDECGRCCDVYDQDPYPVWFLKTGRGELRIDPGDAIIRGATFVAVETWQAAGAIPLPYTHKVGDKYRDGTYVFDGRFDWRQQRDPADMMRQINVW